MSSVDISLSLNGIERRALAGATRPPLRFVLCSGETMRLPRQSATITVLAGSAWITEGGRDVVLAPGAFTEIGKAGDFPVISAAGTEPLLVQVD